jgi:hypothetical protein
VLTSASYSARHFIPGRSENRTILKLWQRLITAVADAKKSHVCPGSGALGQQKLLKKGGLALYGESLVQFGMMLTK